MNPSNDTWSEYRKWRNISLFALVGYVPIVFGVGVLSMRLFDTFTPAFVLAFAWMAFVVIVGNICLRFPCPRCGKAFFAKWWYYNGFARRCVHCGLLKYADPLLRC
jgi:membrane protein DedA with SNARE-associated domain